jgi:DeoR family glycerol-3-phosphate regulon repressor
MAGAGTRWQSEILELLRGEGRASISELAENLQVSGETIRRHVRPLVEDGRLLRVHGAVALPRGEEEPPFLRRMSANAGPKRAIAQSIAGRVPDGTTVMIDTGSTTAYAAAALVARQGLTVITNSIEIARPFVGRNGHRVYVAGGEIKADLAAVVGQEAIAFIGQFRADLAILSVGAIDPVHGFMDYHLDETRIARAMLARAEGVVVLADRAKFGARAAVPVCPLGAVGELVTDAAPEAELGAALAAAGVEVLVAGH